MRDNKYNKLTEFDKNIILQKGTEKPFTGKYNDNKEKGIYTCKQCDSPLYKSDNKFNSGCGWPSFDDEIKGAVKRIPDADGVRTEILCNNCGGHLGHVFTGEGYTAKDIRHCVNSVSLNFISVETGKAIFASGCFWGVEHYFKKAKGVISTKAGYTGGTTDNPSYEDVFTGNTGHAEVIEIIYDKKKTSYEELVKLFFETHDPTQVNRQGPDIGTQYRSEIFYIDNEQKSIAESLIKILEKKGLKIATKITKAKKVWGAENYHQDYYNKKGGTPYCHSYTKRF